MTNTIEPIPERWLIRCTPDNLELVGGYYNKHSQTSDTDGCYTQAGGFPILYSHNTIDEYIGNGRGDNKPSYSNFFREPEDIPEITTEQFKKYVIGEDIPEKWVILRDKDNYKIINDWVNKHPVEGDADDYNLRGGYIHSHAASPTGIYKRVRGTIQKGYTEITFEQFKEHILKQKVMSKTYKIERSKLKEMYDAACENYKRQLDKIINSQPFTEDIEFTKEWLDKAFKDLTEVQKPIAYKVFSEYINDKPKDKNAFVKQFDSNMLCNISKELFGNTNTLQIGYGVAMKEEDSEDIQGRCLILDTEAYDITASPSKQGKWLIIRVHKKE